MPSSAAANSGKGLGSVVCATTHPWLALFIQHRLETTVPETYRGQTGGRGVEAEGVGV